jgi:isopenicillin N synthase-like dioxygenase
MSDIVAVSLDQSPSQIAGPLGRSFAEHGFAIVEGHGISGELIAQANAQAKALFALPAEVKRAYHVPGGGGARGYTPFGTEQAKGAKVHDLKEFWHVGRTLPEGHRYADLMPANVWPAEIRGFAAAMEQLFAALETAGRKILSAIALHLNLPGDWFEDAVRDGNSVMRLLHYPPLEGVEAEGAVRAAAHGDINAITLLLGAEEAGLELLTRQGEWLAVEPPGGALVVNIGDMLERLTAGYLPSTLHRVVNPRGAAARRARYSMPFFLHFRPDFLIEPLPQCVERMGDDAAHPPITAHDFLMQRLRDIGLI